MNPFLGEEKPLIASRQVNNTGKKIRVLSSLQSTDAFMNEITEDLQQGTNQW